GKGGAAAFKQHGLGIAALFLRGTLRPADVGPLQGRDALSKGRTRAADERRAGQGRSGGGVLVRVRTLLLARPGARVVAEEGAPGRRVRPHPGDVERYAPNPRAALLYGRGARQARSADRKSVV